MTATYWLFVAFAAVAIATPGPGVLLTVSNALRYGFSRSLPGVFGLAIGMLGVGVVSGAGYLVYLGFTRLLSERMPPSVQCDASAVSHARRLSERRAGI